MDKNEDRERNLSSPNDSDQDFKIFLSQLQDAYDDTAKALMEQLKMVDTETLMKLWQEYKLKKKLSAGDQTNEGNGVKTPKKALGGNSVKAQKKTPAKVKTKNRPINQEEYSDEKSNAIVSEKADSKKVPSRSEETEHTSERRNTIVLRDQAPQATAMSPLVPIMLDIATNTLLPAAMNVAKSYVMKKIPSSAFEPQTPLIKQPASLLPIPPIVQQEPYQQSGQEFPGGYPQRTMPSQLPIGLQREIYSAKTGLLQEQHIYPNQKAPGPAYYQGYPQVPPQQPRPPPSGYQTSIQGPSRPPPEGSRQLPPQQKVVQGQPPPGYSQYQYPLGQFPKSVQIPPGTYNPLQGHPKTQNSLQGHHRNQNPPLGDYGTQNIPQGRLGNQNPPTEYTATQNSTRGRPGNQTPQQGYPGTQTTLQLYPGTQNPSHGYPRTQTFSQGYPRTQTTPQGYPGFQGPPQLNPGTQNSPQGRQTPPQGYARTQTTPQGYLGNQNSLRGYPETQYPSQGRLQNQNPPQGYPSNPQNSLKSPFQQKVVQGQPSPEHLQYAPQQFATLGQSPPGTQNIPQRYPGSLQGPLQYPSKQQSAQAPSRTQNLGQGPSQFPPQ